jgi:hypothetical protein
MKRMTVNGADEVGVEAEAIAEERDISVSQFYAEPLRRPFEPTNGSRPSGASKTT